LVRGQVLVHAVPECSAVGQSRKRWLGGAAPGSQESRCAFHFLEEQVHSLVRFRERILGERQDPHLLEFSSDELPGARQQFRLAPGGLQSANAQHEQTPCRARANDDRRAPRCLR
jgi:hypothetical protein